MVLGSFLPGLAGSGEPGVSLIFLLTFFCPIVPVRNQTFPLTETSQLGRDMAQQDSYRASVTFEDITAYFTEDEWKLLHEWQKELYENVIKEIQQAVNSLGPLIAASVFSLRPKAKEKLFCMDDQICKIKGTDTSSTSDLCTNSDMVASLERTSTKDERDTTQWQISFCPSTEFPFYNSNIDLKKEGDFEPNLMVDPVAEVKERLTTCHPGNGAYARDNHGTDRKKHANTAAGRPVTPVPSVDVFEAGTNLIGDHNSLRSEGSISHTVDTAIVAIKIKEEGEPCPVDDQDSEIGENCGTPTWHKNSTQLVPLIVKEEGLLYPMEHQDLEPSGNVNTQSSDGVMRRKRKYTRRPPLCKAPLGKGNIKGSWFSHKIINASNIFCPGLHSGEEQATVCDNSFVDETYSNLHQATLKESGSNTRKSNRAVCPQNEKPYENTVAKQSICNIGLFQNLASSSRNEDFNTQKKRSYTSADYMQIIDQRRNLRNHEKMHIIHRPYVCLKCPKGFSQMASLIRHQATHSKVKPYQCPQCDKSYNRNDNLIRHQKLHTGDTQPAREEVQQ
ncbi:zinc finger protein 436-like [Ambystoma mexicanum]|uniref:zinc finger protein 436-like n=1 Tax=Ambystoma mexicanum TaxID=8296 RepID=UPI0037E8DE02